MYRNEMGKELAAPEPVESHLCCSTWHGVKS